jgi:hypothetical protein
MTDEKTQSKTGKSSRYASDSSQQKQAPTQPSASSEPTQQPTAAQALAQYGNILSLIPTVKPILFFQLSQAEDCSRGDKHWCLPDVACNARAEMGEQAQQAFDDNRKKCKPYTVQQTEV